MEHKTEQQNNYGWNLTWNATGKFPIIAKRIWKTKADLEAWVNDASDTAVEGLITGVYNDGENNGVYFVQTIGDGITNGSVIKLVNSEEGKGLSANNFTDEYKHILDSYDPESGKYDDTALWTEVNKKVDKVDGKQLSTEDFTTLLKQKLEGLSNYDDSEVTQAVQKLRTDLDTLVSGDTTTAIKTFNEVIAFLDGLEDTEELASIIASIEQQIAAKQDTITDLATIREGAALGATALQSYTEQYKGTVTGVKMNGETKNPADGVVDLGSVVTEHQDLSGKQDKLVSGTNIKTINGQDILGEGDIEIESNSEANVGAVDTDDFVEEPDLAKYLTTKPQSFTDEEKQQVKDNLGINAEDFDLSDYATKEELKGKEDKKVLIDHGADDTTYALTPNVFHKWYDVASLSLTLAEPSDSTVYNEYMFEFISGQTAAVLTLPDTVKWVSTPSIDSKKTYQVSIVNNIGLIAASEPTLMYFTIPSFGVKYYAKNGMTWEDFVNSEYNTNEIFTITILGVMFGKTNLVICNNTPVNVTDKIGPFIEYHVQDGSN